MNIGDTVEIVDIGEIYNEYDCWIMKNAMNYFKFWKEGASPDATSVFTIITKGRHSEGRPETLCLIKDNNANKVYIISERGLKPTEPSPTTSKEIHDKLHVLYSEYNDLGEVLLQIDDVDNPWAYELIQARYNALAQEIESLSMKEWREA